MEKADEIRRRLDDPAVQVVVLSGDSGTGKSSLVKYLALQYEAESRTKSTFWDGVFYFDDGGRGTDAVSRLRQMLRKFHVENESIEASNDCFMLRQLLCDRLQNLNALIIFDGVHVEDRKQVEQLVVPEAVEVKYLLTSQQSHGWKGYRLCEMEVINYATAQEIMARQAQLRDNEIPEADKVCLSSLSE